MRLADIDVLVTFIKVWGQNRPVNCLETCYKVQVFIKQITKTTQKTDKRSPTKAVDRLFDAFWRIFDAFWHIFDAFCRLFDAF